MSSNQLISPRTRMFKLGMCVLKQRTLSAQEAAYCGGMQLKWSSRETITLYALPPHKQFRKLKLLKDRLHLPTNSTEIFEKK